MPDSQTDSSSGVATLIQSAFDQYNVRFKRITYRAKRRFEIRDWRAHHEDSIARFDLYENMLTKTASAIRRRFGRESQDRLFWIQAKAEFARIVSTRQDWELAETYYNSITRKVLSTVGIDREVEFFRLDAPAKQPVQFEIVCRHYSRTRDTAFIVETLLRDFRFWAGYENLARDAKRVADEVDLYLWPITSYGSFESVDVIKSPFYRNRVAYVFGRVNGGGRHIPLILPLKHDKSGIYVDTVLLSEAEASIVFSFAHSYFHVDVQQHGAVIDFLKSIIPDKPRAELYNSLGYNKHGKTEFYRNLHHFVHESKEQFVIAPGKEGAIMIACTLPDFGYVFKVIKDYPCFLRSGDVTTKRTTREEVREKYDLVCHRDRGGRMVDTQEFENLRFKKKRFSQQLLKEFKQAAREAVSIEGDYVVMKHLYVQRKVIPLPMYLQQERDAEQIRHIILDFGFFLKDLAATGIFPHDLFNTWNYGVTRRARVVLFDYDDVQPLERANFRQKPEAQDIVSELTPEEDWIPVVPDDFFVDEIERFSGIPRPLKGIFDSIHADLYSPQFWQTMQSRVRQGEIFDIIPYDRAKCFAR